MRCRGHALCVGPTQARTVSVPAAVALRRQGAPDLLVAYADAVDQPGRPADPAQRRRAAAGFASAAGGVDEAADPARLADLKRTGEWPFVTWCSVQGHLTPDLDLLLAKNPGDLYRQWAARHPGDVRQVTEVAQRFGWSANWTRDVCLGGLALFCLTEGKTPGELGDDDFAAFAQTLAEAPNAGRDAWMHNSAPVFSCTRPAMSCGSASSRCGWPGPARRPSPSGCRRSAGPASARPRCAT